MHRVLKLVLNACVLVLVDFAGITIGFFAWRLSGGPNQLAVQVPLGVALGAAGVMLWLLRCGRWHRLDLEREAVPVFLLVFPCGAALFVPLHFAATGYLTGFGNIVGFWLFALVANLPAPALSAALRRRREARST